MIRLLVGGNHKLITSITSKILTKIFKKNLGCKEAKITCKDIQIDTIDDSMVVVHFNGDILLNKEEILRLIDGKIEVGE